MTQVISLCALPVAGPFYVCQAAQNVTEKAVKAQRAFRIHWLEVDKAPNLYRLAYDDVLDPQTVICEVSVRRGSQCGNSNANLCLVYRHHPHAETRTGTSCATQLFSGKNLVVFPETQQNSHPHTMPPLLSLLKLCEKSVRNTSMGDCYIFPYVCLSCLCVYLSITVSRLSLRVSLRLSRDLL